MTLKAIHTVDIFLTTVFWVLSALSLSSDFIFRHLVYWTRISNYILDMSNAKYLKKANNKEHTIIIFQKPVSYLSHLSKNFNIRIIVSNEIKTTYFQSFQIKFPVLWIINCYHPLELPCSRHNYYVHKLRHFKIQNIVHSEPETTILFHW